MEDTILLRGASRDNMEAIKVLQENNVQFIEVYSSFKSHQPVLYTEKSDYAYKGLDQIKEFANTIKSSMRK